MHAFGAHRDDLDERDLHYVPEVDPATLPPEVTLRDLCSTIYDQTPLMACTANAIAGLVGAVATKEGLALAPPSRLFIYYNERVLENTVERDAGAQLRSGLKVIASLGVPPEVAWPYDSTQLCVRPADAVYAAARGVRISEYRRIAHARNDLRACLASGYPFVAGLVLFRSALQAATTGNVPMPQANDAQLGAHAALCIGYDAERFTFLNSMGPTWGAQGCFSVPAAYLEDRDLTYDLWTFRGIKQSAP